MEPESGDRKEEEGPGKVEDDEEDTGFPLFLLEREDLSEDLAEHPVPDQVGAQLPGASGGGWPGTLGTLCMGAGGGGRR